MTTRGYYVGGTKGVVVVGFVGLLGNEGVGFTGVVSEVFLLKGNFKDKICWVSIIIMF